MVQISEVNIFSVDKSEDSWEIEGEIVFESDLSSSFSTTYLPEDDDFDSFELEINPGKYDTKLLKDMMIESVNDFE